MDFNVLKRYLDPIKNRIWRIVGKAILVALDNSGSSQKVNVSILKNENSSEIERVQEYGLDTYPKTDAQVVILSIGGNRDHALAINISDRRYRPTDLAEGEVALYTHEDTTSGHRVHLKSGATIEIVAGAGVVSGVVTGTCVCAFTGLPHPDVSTTVKASK